MKHTIFGIHISQRTENVPAVQAVLTKYGCNIRTRLGIHDADATSCSPSGLRAGRRLRRRGGGLLQGAVRTSRASDLQRMDFEA